MYWYYKKFIQLFSSKKKTKSKKKELKIVPEDIECCICLEPIQTKGKCILACGHCIHIDCMLKTYEVNNACPLCRQKISTHKMKKRTKYVYDDISITHLLYGLECASEYMGYVTELINYTEDMPRDYWVRATHIISQWSNLRNGRLNTNITS